MRLHDTDPLFAWARLDDHPQLSSLKLLLELLPDQQLLDGLRAARGNGRDDFPVDALGGTVVFTVALRHPSFTACLAELNRNPALYRLLGISRTEDIPNDWNLSRFLEVLGTEPHLSRLRAVFDVLAQRLGRAVPNLGKDLAGDSTGLSGRAQRDGKAVDEELRQGLPQPSGGRKEYKDAAGTVTKVVEWFGYKHHRLVDVKHEVPLAYAVTDTKAGDNELIGPLLKQARANLPQGRIETLAYDKAADDEKVHALLQAERIKPLIQNRACWPKDGDQEKVLGGRVPLNVVYDEAGTVHCYDTRSDPPVRHRMAYTGYEKDRETLQYRCPARHEGWVCPSDSRCKDGKSYGLLVRVERELDLRRFPPIPRATRQFERRYKGRTAVERVNGRLKVFWGADDGNLTGSRRFGAYIGVVMAVCLGFATLRAMTRRRDGSLGQTRLGSIALALRESALGQAEAEGAGPTAASVGSAGEPTGAVAGDCDSS